MVGRISGDVNELAAAYRTTRPAEVRSTEPGGSRHSTVTEPSTQAPVMIASSIGSCVRLVGAGRMCKKESKLVVLEDCEVSLCFLRFSSSGYLCPWAVCQRDLIMHNLEVATATAGPALSPPFLSVYAGRF